jgi:hypothetical protein
MHKYFLYIFAIKNTRVITIFQKAKKKSTSYQSKLFFFFFCREENPKVKLLGFILNPQAVTLREQEDGLQIINIY